MSGHRIETERRIEASPEAVWKVVTDLDGAADVMSAIVAIQRLEGDGYEPGVRWRETRRMFGREADEVMEVAEVDAPHRTVVVAENRGTEYETIFTLIPDGEGTLLRVSFTAETPHPGPAQRVGWLLFGKAGMKATRKALDTDLEEIAAAVEG
ncbi:SRPBCC family protein [Demequina pelophila]|uniref:SRPBCC family protein n=1 Tax=Demequina pelophila TaxID=1638984 RepID=UPI000785765C|nr:SRPBCC family protein [Demequina pelophila]